MKNKNWKIRALRTFIQAAVGYLAINAPMVEQPLDIGKARENIKNITLNYFTFPKFYATINTES